MKKNKINLLLLQETKIFDNINRIITEIWGLQSCGWEWVPSVGASGGLISFWDEKVLQVVDVIKSQRILAVKFISLSDSFIWAAGKVNGLNDEGCKGAFWTA